MMNDETPLGEQIDGGNDHVADNCYETFGGEAEQPYDGAGFPGCGDGSDDLADYNANEADDYRNE